MPFHSSELVRVRIVPREISKHLPESASVHGALHGQARRRYGGDRSGGVPASGAGHGGLPDCRQRRIGLLPSIVAVDLAEHMQLLRIGMSRVIERERVAQRAEPAGLVMQRLVLEIADPPALIASIGKMRDEKSG